MNLSPDSLTKNFGFYLLVRLQAVPEVAPVLEHFQGMRAALLEAMAAHEAARDLEARMRSNRETAKVAWMDGYRRTHGMLQDHYAGDPRRAESFFREVRAQARNQVEDDFELEEDLEEAAVVEAEADEDDDPDSESIDDGSLARSVSISDIANIADSGDILGDPAASGALGASAGSGASGTSGISGLSADSPSSPVEG